MTFVLDGRPDVPIGSTDSQYPSGNNIVIDIGGGRYLLIGHLSSGSIQVKVGDQVKLGQPIAKVGNSGNTTQPHLHIQAQSVGTGIGDLTTIDVPTFIRTLHTYPLCSPMWCSRDEVLNPNLPAPTLAVATCSGPPTNSCRRSHQKVS